MSKIEDFELCLLEAMQNQGMRPSLVQVRDIIRSLKGNGYVLVREQPLTVTNTESPDDGAIITINRRTGEIAHKGGKLIIEWI